MPIPKPRDGEDRDGFVSRCMGNDTMAEEYPDQSQRSAVCNNTWRQAKKVEAAKESGNTLDAEIFAVGKWNGMSFDREDLQAMVDAFKALGDQHQVPLKLGHSEDEDLRAGQPALGWVEDVWVAGDKLMARFTAVPDLVYNAIQEGRYRNVSIELDIGVSHQGQAYDFVLSGVALLGSEIPAVNTLEDLTAYMAAATIGYSKRRHATFTAIGGEEGDDEPGNGGDTMGMTPEEKAEFDRLKSSVDELKGERDDFKAKYEAEQAKRQEVEQAQKKADFERKKADFEARLEALVKDEKITPAKRDEVMGRLKEDDENSHDVVKFTVETFEETFGASGKKDRDVPDKKEQGLAGKDGEEGETDERPDVTFQRKVSEHQAQHNVSYREASRAVAQANPDLLRSWADQDLKQAQG